MALPLKTSGSTERKVVFAKTGTKIRVAMCRWIDLHYLWTESEFMSLKKKESDGETVIWSYDALLLAKRNAGVSLDAKFSID